MEDKEKAVKLRAVLLVALNQVDYTKQACNVTEMVGAILPAYIISQARRVLEETK